MPLLEQQDMPTGINPIDGSNLPLLEQQDMPTTIDPIIGADLPQGGGIKLGSLLGGAGDIVSGLLGLSGANQQANADVQQGQFQAQQLEMNATLAKMQADEATNKGAFESQQEGLKTAGTEGSEATGFAGQGINANFGTARKVQQETSSLGSLDAATIQHNANMEAWGYKVKAQNDETEATEATIEADNKANSTLLGGQAGFLGSAFKAGSSLLGV